MTIVGGMAVGLVFARRQRALTDPLFDSRVFRAPAVTASLVATTLGFLVVFGVSLFVAQYLQLVLGYGPLEAGLWTLPLFVGFISGSLLTPFAANRLGSAVDLSVARRHIITVTGACAR